MLVSCVLGVEAAGITGGQGGGGISFPPGSGITTANITNVFNGLQFTNGVVYVDTNGNDSTAVIGNKSLPYSSLSKAVAACPNLGTVVASPQTFYPTESLLFTNTQRWLFYGASIYQTNASVNLTKLVSNSVSVYGGYFNNIGVTVAIFGVNNCNSNAYYFNGCVMEGQNDVFHNTASQLIQDGATFQLDYCTVFMHWDAFTVWNATTNVVWTLNHCSVRGVAPIAGGQRAVLPLGGKMILNNCELESSQWAVVGSSNSVVEVNNCTLRPAFGLNAAWVPVEVQDSRSRIEVNGLSFDRTRCVSTNGGTLIFNYQPTNNYTTGNTLLATDSTNQVWDTMDWGMPSATNFFAVDTNTLIVTGSGNSFVNAGVQYKWNTTLLCYTNSANNRCITNQASGFWSFKQLASDTVAYSNITLVSRIPWIPGNGTAPGPTTRYGLVLTNIAIVPLTFPSGATITNTWLTNVTIDFASTSVGAQVTQNVPWSGAGIGTNCVVTVTPSPVFNAIIGTWQGTSTNDIVQVRFVPTAAAQDPPSGNYTIKVEQFK